MTPDIIICWPRFADYPLWRKWIASERGWFGRVYVVFTDHAGEDISEWVRAQLGPRIICLESHADGRDWRDAAINLALDCSGAEWIWFTEQDFFIRKPGPFWAVVMENARRFEAVGWFDLGDQRLHPSCLFVTRAAIERTHRYFGTPPVDHFYTFTRQLIDGGTTIFDIATVLNQPDDFEHLAGLSQNHWLVDQGEDEGVYKRERFRAYLRECLDSGMELEPEWEARARREIA